MEIVFGITSRIYHPKIRRAPRGGPGVVGDELAQLAVVTQFAIMCVSGGAASLRSTTSLRLVGVVGQFAASSTRCQQGLLPSEASHAGRIFSVCVGLP